MPHNSIYKTRFIRELQCNREISPRKSIKVITTLEEINQKLYHGLADDDCLLSLVRNPYACYDQLVRICTHERWILGFIAAMIDVLREPSFLLAQKSLDNGEAMQWESLFLAAQEFFGSIREGLNDEFNVPADPRIRSHPTNCIDSHDDVDDEDSHTTHMECQHTSESEEPAQKRRLESMTAEGPFVIDLTKDDSDVDVIDLTGSDMEEGELSKR